MSASGVVYGASCLFIGVEIITDGSNAATVTLYDSASGVSAGKEIFKGTVSGSANFGKPPFDLPIMADNGIYASISGTGAGVIVHYRKLP